MKKGLAHGILSFVTSALFATMAQAYVVHQDYKIVDGSEEDWKPGKSFTMTQGSKVTISLASVTDGMKINEWRFYKNYGLGGYSSYETLSSGTSITLSYNAKYEQSGETWYLVPCFEYVTYNLEYDADGGSPTPEGGTGIRYDTTLTAPSASWVTKENCTLTGWKSKTGKLITQGATFDGSSLGITKDNQDVTLIAQWAGATYSVTLVLPDGATVEKNLTSYTYGTTVALPKATKDDGSEFEGWYDNENYEGSKVSRIEKYDSGDLTFYAKFATGIHFDGNGSTDGVMANLPFSAGVPVTLTLNAFEKKYVVTCYANDGTTSNTTVTAKYDFNGWNNMADGSGQYTYRNGESVKNPCGSKADSVTLYAQWKPDEVKVTLPAAPKSRAGYSFLGWYTAQDGGERVGGAGDSFAPDDTLSLYAQWSGSGELSAAVGLTNAVLTTSCDGGDNLWQTSVDASGIKCLELNVPKENGVTAILSMSVVGPGTVTYRTHASKNGSLTVTVNGKEVTVNPNSSILQADTFGVTNNFRVSKNGSVEVQWRVQYQDFSGTGRIYLTDVTWTPDSAVGAYTITTSADPKAGGTVKGGGSYKAGKVATLTASPKSGYKFIRWNDGSTENPREVTVTADAEYVATFSSDYYSINYNKNGGSGTMSAQIALRDEETLLTANAFTRTGYTFAGWATTKDGSAAYADQAKVTNLAKKGGSVTLYAVWKNADAKTVTVTITGTTKTVKYTGKKQTISGYTFTSDVAAYKESYCKFTGVAKVSGTEVGEYPMGLEASDFTNKNDDYSVTFVVNDGKLVITGDDEDPDPDPSGNEGVEIDFGAAATGASSATVSVGAAVEWTVTPLTDGAKVTVSKLPTGLKYTAKTGLITGTPTKAKTFTTTVKTVANKKTVTQTFEITVEALPTTLVGTYWGAAKVGGYAGQFQLKLLATGKATGYFYAAGKKISLKSTTLATTDDGYAVTVSYTYNRVKYTDEILLKNTATVEGAKGTDVDLWSASLASPSDVLDDIDARRDTIKEVYGKAVAKTTTYVIEDEEFADGEYLKAKVTTAGAVTVSGKLFNAAGKLTSVSCSSHLVVDDDGAAYCWITVYKTVSKQDPIVYELRWELPE